jgi:hypothetical protein
MWTTATLVTRAARAGILCVLTAAVACDFSISDFDTDNPETPLDSIIQLSRVNGHASVPADGRSLDTLIAVLPDKANQRLVTFSTTHGTFEITNTKELKVRAETRTDPSRLEARAVLRADTVAVRAIVSASVGEFRDTVSIAFGNLAPGPE